MRHFAGGLAPYVADPLVNLALSALVILGGLGFLVQLNLVTHFQHPRRHRLLVYSLLTLWTTGLLLLLGWVGLAALEWHNPATFGPLSPAAKTLAAFFQSMTPRSGGFSTVDIESMGTASLLLMMTLMYIGGNSGSTGGGIKTSTFALLVGSAWNMVQGRGT
ncbi:potassium transporter TrkG [Deinococcus lacus]|uniref:Potassium transporter TrkG n=1 Tax=Deinococcus lacus TaxID=392561 RepID=A0ABW1YDR8_9DEIO